MARVPRIEAEARGRRGKRGTTDEPKRTSLQHPRTGYVGVSVRHHVPIMRPLVVTEAT